MLGDQALVAENGDAGDGVHVLGMQEVYKFRYIVKVNVVLAEQRVFEGNVDAAVGVLDVEDDGVAPDFAPVTDDAESVVAARHDAGQIDGADFKISGDRNRLLDNRRGKNSRDHDVFIGFEDVAGAVSIGVADGF